MGPRLEAKKERNALLDLLKLLCCILAVLAHFGGFFRGFFDYPAFNPHLLNVGMAYQWNSFNGYFGINAVASISIFTFLTGYWFIDAFKRQQRQNIFGKGKDVSIISKYFFKNYSAYWPVILFGTLFAMIFYYAWVPGLHGRVGRFFYELGIALPRLLGFSSLGIGVAPYYGISEYAAATENFTANMDAVAIVHWNSPLWYMLAIIVLMPAMYAIFMKSEKIGLFVVAPMLYMAHNVTYSFVTSESVWQAAGVDSSWIRLGGPVALGIFGWYFVDWIKKQEFSKKGQILYNIFAGLSLVIFLYVFKVGVGGFQIYDIAMALFAIFVLAGKDVITTSINKVCLKIPGKKFWGMASVGMYVLHYPVLESISYSVANPDAFPVIASFFQNFKTIDQWALFCLVLMIVLMIPYYFVDKYIIRKLTAWVVKLSKCNEPVVVNEPVATGVEK